MFLRRRLAWIAGLALAGLAVSIWLLILHQSATLSSTCQFSSYISCGIIKFPSYSDWFGVPVPVFSIFFYVFVLLIAWRGRAGNEAEVDRPVIYLWFLSLAALGSTLYMVWISAFVLRMLCPFCAVLYVVSIIYVWEASRALGRVPKPWLPLVTYDLKRIHRSFWIPAMAAGGILILLIGPAIFKGKATTDQVQHEIAPETQRMLGSPTAPVTLTCFSDFQCPYCRVAGQLLEAFEGEMRGKVRVVFKFFPLDQTCNPSGGRHPLGCKAALAAYCAGIQGRFWPFHDQIFANQETLHERDFLSFAQALGLDINAFARCVEDPGSMAGIRKDIDEGIRLGVSGTPSLFIDGRRYQGPLTVAALKDMIPQ